MVAEYGQSSTATDKIRYIMLDRQGSTRAILNQSATVLARFDYQPFGEEISTGVGMRTTSQGYGGSDSSRQRYALTERDDATGLDHTWWRKYENIAGRWTSPDPYKGSMEISDPQSFNRFAYVTNDPMNLVDPTGLYWVIDWSSCRAEIVWDPREEIWVRTGREICQLTWINTQYNLGGGGGGGPRGTGRKGAETRPGSQEYCDKLLDEIKRLEDELAKRKFDLEEDPQDMDIFDPDGVRTHQKTFEQKQKSISEAIRKYDKYCKNHKGGGVPQRARELSRALIPQRTRPRTIIKSVASPVQPAVSPPGAGIRFLRWLLRRPPMLSTQAPKP
jgi:RHS repeat-associated protein